MIDSLDFFENLLCLSIAFIFVGFVMIDIMDFGFILGFCGGYILVLIIVIIFEDFFRKLYDT